MLRGGEDEEDESDGVNLFVVSFVFSPSWELSSALQCLTLIVHKVAGSMQLQRNPVKKVSRTSL